MIKPLKERRAQARGLTLIEVLMTLMVFVTSVLSLMGIYGNVATLRETGRNLNQATLDARAVMEMMRENSNSGLATVTGTNWEAWAKQNNLTSLSGEAVTVSYGDTNADPLNVTVRVAWTERGRARFTTLQSFITQR